MLYIWLLYKYFWEPCYIIWTLNELVINTLDLLFWYYGIHHMYRMYCTVLLLGVTYASTQSLNQKGEVCIYLMFLSMKNREVYFLKGLWKYKEGVYNSSSRTLPAWQWCRQSYACGFREKIAKGQIYVYIFFTFGV